jgi:hypothetical protein
MVFTSFVKYFNNIVVQLANLYVESDEARSMRNMLNRWGRVFVATVPDRFCQHLVHSYLQMGWLV